MKKGKLEAILAYHCAPALAGIKPSNIVFIKKSEVPDVYHEIIRLNHFLNARNIHIEIMRECEKRIVLMVYRKDILENHLRKEENRDFLVNYGYKKDASFEEDMEHLKTQLILDCFPHEIGIFLGYPLCDVIGYINNHECLHTGDWKVYDNVEESKMLFERFKACRKATCRRMSCGCCLAQIFSPDLFLKSEQSA